MRVVEPKAIIMDKLDGEQILKKIELCGRTCYKSEDKITEDSAKKFVTMLVNHGHESVLEHVSITVRFICDRGISHELVRHRVASYSQESTRYVKYDDIEVVMPGGISNDEEQKQRWYMACEASQAVYKAMINAGAKAQDARAVLPTCLKTEIVTTANLREWRHIIKMRTSKGAHPDIAYLMNDLLKQFKSKIPVVFDDIEVDS